MLILLQAGTIQLDLCESGGNTTVSAAGKQCLRNLISGCPWKSA